MNDLELRTELERAQPFIDALKGVPQEPEWHAEGDVAIHTTMVREALETIPEFQTLDRATQNILRFAAATHDIGKVTTTQQVPDGNGVLRWRAYGHSLTGARMLALHWWNTGYALPPETRNLIFNLVRYHGRPIHGEDQLEAHVASTSTFVPINLVALLAEADMRGRVAQEKTPGDALLKIDLFRETARELGCFDKPYSFANTHARYTFFHTRASHLNWQAPDTPSFTVSMTVGLPASGKSSATQKLGLPILSRDEIREESKHRKDEKSMHRPHSKKDQGRTSQAFQEKLKEFLRLKQPFVIDGTNLIKNLRGNTIDICVKYGARVEILHFDRDRKTVLAQNRARASVVPEDIIERMAEKHEPPTLAECHEVKAC